MMLGRKVNEYELSEFETVPHKILEQGEEPVFEIEGDFSYICVFPLDMPLLTKNSIRRAVETMWRRNIHYIKSGDGYIVKKGEKSVPRGFCVNDDSFLSVGDAKSYELVYNQLRQNIVQKHLEQGVEILDTKSVHIDDTVICENGAKILPFTKIFGQSKISSGAEISSSEIINCEIAKNAVVFHSYLADSFVGESASIGPFSRLRSAKILAKVRIGDFVEVKASTLNEGVKAAHLTYVGDADVGARTNLGCGTVFCNYDGKLKHHTKVGEDCFIGANTNLIAPVEIGDRAFIAAGTTVTKNVLSDEFCIGRVRQETREKPKKKESVDSADIGTTKEDFNETYCRTWQSHFKVSR
ncbi:MAG TPA: DapH/DapD/GlmU-related protein, partial [Clostridia bacterium]|nr:DapH/DapD/GlmU-related protein [Clostridia bacterium]